MAACPKMGGFWRFRGATQSVSGDPPLGSIPGGNMAELEVLGIDP
jgi:hypothetical protein